MKIPLKSSGGIFTKVFKVEVHKYYILFPTNVTLVIISLF